MGDKTLDSHHLVEDALHSLLGIPRNIFLVKIDSHSVRLEKSFDALATENPKLFSSMHPDHACFLFWIPLDVLSMGLRWSYTEMALY